MKQKYILGIFALSMIALLGIGMVSAFHGFKNRLSEEDREALANAMDSGDFESWASIKRAQISEEKFEQERTRHQERAEFRKALQEARESGDLEAMQQLKEEFGLGKRIHKRNMNFSGCPFAK
jgi:hypothetical protein